MAPFFCGDSPVNPPSFGSTFLPFSAWRLFQLRLTRLFGTGLAEPNWWDPAQSGVPLVVFSSSWCPMKKMNDGWSTGIVVKCGLWQPFRNVLLNMMGCGKVVSLWIFTILSMKISNNFPESKRQVPRSSGHTCLVRAIWHWWSELDQAPNRCVQRDWGRQMNRMIYHMISI